MLQPRLIQLGLEHISRAVTIPVEAGSEILNTEALSKMAPSLERRGVGRCFRFGAEREKGVVMRGLTVANLQASYAQREGQM